MDRAVRRQNRHAAKLFGTRPGRGKGSRGKTAVRAAEVSNRESADHEVLNLSDGESTDDVAGFRMTPGETPSMDCKPDLKADLEISDAKVQKWKRLASERQTKITELETHVHILEQKIKKIISEDSPGRPGPSEAKLKAENELLKQRNEELVQAIKDQCRQRSSELEALTKLLQGTRTEDDDNIEANGGVAPERNPGDFEDRQETAFRRDGSDRPGDKMAEKTADGIGNGGIKVETRFMGQAVGGGQDNAKSCGDSKMDASVDIMGGQSSEENGPAEVNTWDGARKQTATSSRWEGSGPSKYAASSGREGHGRQVVSPEISRKNQGTPENAVLEALITEKEHKSAQTLVSRDFLTWLNKRIRRPTATEISLHKSKVGELNAGRASGGRDTFVWTGILGSSLLKKFSDETNFPQPAANDLTTMFRDVMHIDGCRRMNDYLWCLVWTDCMNLEELPGYTLYAVQDPKRFRPSSPEENVRAVRMRNMVT